MRIPPQKTAKKMKSKPHSGGKYLQNILHLIMNRHVARIYGVYFQLNNKTNDSILNG